MKQDLKAEVRDRIISTLEMYRHATPEAQADALLETLELQTSTLTEWTNRSQWETRPLFSLRFLERDRSDA